jgi:hypothetical protein
MFNTLIPKFLNGNYFREIQGVLEVVFVQQLHCLAFCNLLRKGLSGVQHPFVRSFYRVASSTGNTRYIK